MLSIDAHLNRRGKLVKLDYQKKEENDTKKEQPSKHKKQ